MSILNLDGFMTGFSWIAAVALAVTVTTVTVWTVQFFVANRSIRVAQRTPLVPYYRGLVLSH